MALYNPALSFFPGEDPPDWAAPYLKGTPGAFAVTVGPALASNLYGGRQTHIYGDEIKFVLDYHALAAQLPGVFGGLGTLATIAEGTIGGNLVYGVLGTLLGTTGNVTMALGNAAGCTYVGDKYAVDRLSGPTVTLKTEKGFFGGEWKTLPGVSLSGPPAGGTADEVKGRILQTTGVIVAVLLALMTLAGLALELLVALKYPDALKKTPKAKPEDTEIVGLIRDLDLTLTSILMGLTLQVEKLAAAGVAAAGSTADAAQTVAGATKAVLHTALVKPVRDGTLYALKLGADDAFDAAKRWAVFLALLVFLVGPIAGGIAFGVAAAKGGEGK